MPTLSELRSVVRQDETLNSTTVISDANLNTLLNEGALQFATDGHPYVLPATWNAVASTQEYVLSGASPKVTGFLELYWPAGALIYTQSSGSTRYAGTDFTIVSENWLNREIPGWKDADASDSLTHVYLSFDSSGNLILGVYPKSSTTTPVFKLWFLSRGTDMSADGNYPYTNSTTNLTHIEPYQKGIAYWAMHVLHRDKTKMVKESDRYLGLYQAQADQCREAQERIMRTEVMGLKQQGMATAAQTFGGL